MCSLLVFGRDEYFRMKLQWKSVSEEQERRNSRLRDYRSLIGESSSQLNLRLVQRFPVWILVIPSHCRFCFSEKDVNRTDRTNRFYEGIDNPGLVLLHDILMTYCMYDFDLGETSHSCTVSSSPLTEQSSLVLEKLQEQHS